MLVLRELRRCSAHWSQGCCQKLLVFPLTVLTVTRAKEKGTFLPENEAWHFSSELLLHQEMQMLLECSRQRTSVSSGWTGKALSKFKQLRRKQMLWVNTLFLFFIQKQHLSCRRGKKKGIYKPQKGGVCRSLKSLFFSLSSCGRTFRSPEEVSSQQAFKSELKAIELCQRPMPCVLGERMVLGADVGRCRGAFLLFWCHLLVRAHRKVRKAAGNGNGTRMATDVPPGAGTALPPCRAHSAVGAALPILSIAAFSTIHS